MGNYCSVFNILAGVAYSKHIVQLYSYHGGNDIRAHLEVGLLFELVFVLQIKSVTDDTNFCFFFVTSD